MVLKNLLIGLYYGLAIYMLYFCFTTAAWLSIHGEPKFESVEDWDEISPFEVPNYAEENYGRYPVYKVQEKYDLYVKSAGFRKYDEKKLNHEIKYFGCTEEDSNGNTKCNLIL